MAVRRGGLLHCSGLRGASLLGAILLGVGVTGPARGQAEGAPDLETLLGMFGLSCGEIVFVLLGIAVVAWLGLYFGVRLAGLAGGLGKALATLCLQALIWLPVALVVAFLPMPSQGLPAILATQGVNVLVGGMVVRWQYSTDWKRAFFAEMAATILSILAMSLMIWLIF